MATLPTSPTLPTFRNVPVRVASGSGIRRVLPLPAPVHYVDGVLEGGGALGTADGAAAPESTSSGDHSSPTGIGGVALQRFAVAVLTAEGLGEHGIGRLIGRRVVALVACLVGAEERTLESLWSAERTRGCWIDGRSRHRARCQTVVITGLVLIAHPLVTLH